MNLLIRLPLLSGHFLLVPRAQIMYKTAFNMMIPLPQLERSPCIYIKCDMLANSLIVHNDTIYVTDVAVLLIFKYL
jgi:hypothetical protein